MAKAKCPVCGSIVDLGKEPEVGEVVECPDCGSELIIRKRGRKYYLESISEEEGYEEEFR
ncbi:MAG: hypothetical protein DRJ43_06565 [Thermoprotei archaeon]|nr:MAG: hypothetical protein DRJ43_06565 [Thermoprotei archaeon]